MCCQLPMFWTRVYIYLSIDFRKDNSFGLLFLSCIFFLSSQAWIWSRSFLCLLQVLIFCIFISNTARNLNVFAKLSWDQMRMYRNYMDFHIHLSDFIDSKLTLFLKKIAFLLNYDIHLERMPIKNVKLDFFFRVKITLRIFHPSESTILEFLPWDNRLTIAIVSAVPWIAAEAQI